MVRCKRDKECVEDLGRCAEQSAERRSKARERRRRQYRASLYAKDDVVRNCDRRRLDSTNFFCAKRAPIPSAMNRNEQR